MTTQCADCLRPQANTHLVRLAEPFGQFEWVCADRADCNAFAVAQSAGALAQSEAGYAAEIAADEAAGHTAETLS